MGVPERKFHEKTNRTTFKFFGFIPSKLSKFPNFVRLLVESVHCAAAYRPGPGEQSPVRGGLPSPRHSMLIQCPLFVVDVESQQCSDPTDGNEKITAPTPN